MIWIPMVAKYASKCDFCEFPIRRGDSIRYEKKKFLAVHNKCFKKRYKR